MLKFILTAAMFIILLRVAATLNLAAEELPPQTTAVILDFNDPTLLRLDNLVRTSHRSHEYGLGTRLTLKSGDTTDSTTGVMILDAVNTPLKKFRYVTCELMIHDSVSKQLSLLFEYSENGDTYQTFPALSQGRKIRDIPSTGLALWRFVVDTEKEQRFLKLTMKIAPKDYWRLQLASCAISLLPPSETIPDLPVSKNMVDKGSEKESSKDSAEIKLPEAVPTYHLTTEELALDRFLARQLTNAEELTQITFTDSWAEATLPSIIGSPNYPGVKASQRSDAPRLGYIYRATLRADYSPQAERLHLVLPLSAYVTSVFVDNRLAAHFTEAFLPLTADLTDFVTPGRDVELVIRTEGYHAAVLEQGGRVRYPCGSMVRFTGGLAVQPLLKRVNSVRPTEFALCPVRGKLLLSTVAVNETAQTVSGKIEFTITDMQQEKIFQRQLAVEIPAGDKTALSLDIPVDNELALWDIGQPNLYFAEARLLQNDRLEAVEKVRFGYRYVEIDKGNIMLNGRPLRLFGPWAHRGEWMYRNKFHEKRLSHREVYETLLSMGMNIGRLHCQPYPDYMYAAADEAGFLLIAETAINHRPANEAAEIHSANFVRTMRNHPSIIIWSGSNEFEHWITPRPQKTMDFLEKIQTIIHHNDPSLRPVQHSGFGDANGNLDLYNVHYPAEGAGTPARFYWTRDPERFAPHLLKHNFTTYNPVGKKPILYGEELIPSSERDTSLFFGEVGLRTFYAAQTGDSAAVREQQLQLGRIWQYHTRAEREQNIAMICPNIFYLGLDSPFVETLAQEFRPAGAYPKLANPVLISGEENTVSIIVFEDRGFPVQGQVQVKLTDEKGIDEELATFVVDLPGCSLREIELQLKIPATTVAARQILMTQFVDAAGNLVYEDRSPAYVMPRPRPVSLGLTVHTWGNDQRFQDFASRYGIECLAVDLKQPSGQIWVIFPDVEESQLARHAELLAAFVEKGGHLLVLERIWKKSFLPGNALFTNVDNLSMSCVGFMRQQHHPVFVGLDDLCFAYWNQDLTLASQAAFKNESGNTETWIDSGKQLNTQLLWAYRHGRGLGIVNHLDLLKNLDRLPAAELLLKNILLYLADAKWSPTYPATLLAGGSDDFAAMGLRRLGCQTASIDNNNNEDRDNDNKILIVTGAAITAGKVTDIATQAKKYRQVIFLNAPRDSVALLGQELCGQAPETTDTPQVEGKKKAGAFLYFTQQLQLYKGLTSDDLNWNSSFIPDYVFTPSASWQGAISGGYDAFFTHVDGRSVGFINLPYDRDVPDADKKDWFTAQWLTRLGATLPLRPARNRDDTAAEYKPLSLTEVANASHRELFTDFPTGQVSFHDIPFRIPVETAASNCAALRLNGHARLQSGTNINFDTPWDIFHDNPGRVTLSLPEDQAESFFLLLTATYNWKLSYLRQGDAVAECTLVYKDGSTASLLLNSGDRIASGRDFKGALKRGVEALTVPILPNAPGEQARIFLTEWENPHPEKKISRMEIVSAYNPPFDLILSGITLKTTSLAFH